MVVFNTQDVLRQIAKQMHAGVRKCAVYDANVCTLDPDPSNAAGIPTVEGQPFFEKTSFIRQGRKVRMFANEIFIKVRISHVFDITPISVNSSNKNDFQTLAGKVKAGGRAYQIFSRKSPLGGDHSATIDTLIPFVERLRPTPEESIHIYGTEMIVYLYRPGLERTLLMIDSAVSFLEDAERVIPHTEQTNFSELPPQFHPLIPLIKAWGLSDDGEREERREQTSKAVLQRIVDEVKPYYAAINSYLDSFGDRPEPEAATALGALAEFAVETDLYLKNT